MRRRSPWPIAAGLLALLCAPAGAQTLRIGLRDDPNSLDPVFSNSYTGRIVLAGLCDKLLDIDDKLNIVPQLAAGFEWADPKTLVLHLRPGVSFHDGEPFDAAAVKFNLERELSTQGSFRRSEVSSLDHVEVADPLTARLVMRAPAAPFPAQLTDRAGMMVAPRAAQEAGEAFGTRPVCAGPFRFTERVSQDHITLDRFSGYWNAGAIHLDRVVYRPIPDSAVRLANLQAGTIELSEYVVPTDVPAVEADPKLRLVNAPGLGYYGITFNTANGPRAATPLGRDARVRRAFSLAIDRAALNQVVFNGLFTPTAQAFPPDSPYHPAAVPVPARDVAAARKLLADAGATTPVRVDLMVQNQPDIVQAATVIQSMAAEAGFAVRVVATEFASSLAAAGRGDFEAYITGWSGRADPDGQVYGFLHSGGTLNYGRYNSSAVDGLLDQARTVSDPAQRHALYDQVWTTEQQDMPVAYLWVFSNVVGLSRKLSGFRPVPDGIIRLQGLELAR